MKKKTENAVIKYDQEMVTENVGISFTKTTTAGAVTVQGTITKDEVATGDVYYNGLEKGDNLLTSLKHVSNLTDEEVAAVYAAVPRCIAEIMAD